MKFYRPTTTQGILAALSSILRAVRAWRFYPKGHPTRRNSLSLAHTAMLQLLDGNTLSLACGLTGFSFPDGEAIKDATGLSAALAHELFVRRVRKITFFHDLFQEDLLELLKILCLSPEVIQQSGGVDTLMAARGIRSISVNEFDLAVIRKKRQKIERGGIKPQGIDETETGGDAVPEGPQPSLQDVRPSEQQLQELLGRLANCDDDDTYLTLVRQAVACAYSFQSFQSAYLLFPLVELLAAHGSDGTRSKLMRDCALFAIEQIISIGEVLQIAIERTGQENGVSKKALLAVVKAGGTTAITSVLDLIGRTTNLKTRKTLLTILGNLDEAALPVLLNLMHGSPWFITRNICAILGSIGSREALKPLTGCLYHPDLRVRKEAIRSLALLGGHDAEEAIIGILRGTGTALYPQAVASLGGMKSRKSLPELLKVVSSRDLFLNTLSLKIDALAAIAMIGDRQVTPHLFTLLEERHILAAERGRKLKTAIAACLGKLGDARAVPYLKKLASDSGTLGSACSDAILMIEKAEGRPDGIS